MLYIIDDCLFYILTFANNRKRMLFFLLMEDIGLVLLYKICFLHTMGHLMLFLTNLCELARTFIEMSFV